MLVSVIIPTFNRAHLVTKTLDSVLAQSHRNFEIIVIDDGSRDDTTTVLAPYRGLIRYYHQENQGLNAARNYALREAKGEYIALLDSDDLWLDFKLELQLAVLRRFPQAGFLFSDFFIYRGDERQPEGLRTWHHHRHDWSALYADRTTFRPNELGTQCALPRETIDCYFGDIYRPSLHEPFVLPSTTLISRAHLDSDLLFTSRADTHGAWEPLGDYEFFCRLSRRHGAVYLDLETILNRSHEDAVRLTRLRSDVQAQRRMLLIERLWKADQDFYNQHKDEVDEALATQMRRHAREQIRHQDIQGARSTYAALSQQYPAALTPIDRVLWLASRVPGGQSLLRTVLRLREKGERHTSRDGTGTMNPPNSNDRT